MGQHLIKCSSRLELPTSLQTDRVTEMLNKSERKTFDELMDISRLYNVAGVCSCKPVLLHPILMSIIFEHYKQLNN
jgi:hypothetical protein